MKSPQGVIGAFLIVAIVILGIAAPAAGLAILVLGLLAALIIDFNAWSQADDAGEHRRSPLGLMEPLSGHRAKSDREPPAPSRKKGAAAAESQGETSS